MSKTILIDDEPATKNVYALNLSTYIGTEVVERKNSRDAIDLLEVLSSFDLIVMRESVRGEPTLRKILDYLESKNIVIPIVVLGRSSIEKEFVHSLDLPIQVKTLLAKVSGLLDVKIEEVVEKKIVADYMPVNIDYFLLMNRTPCEVFIQIKQADGGVRYVKRIHANDEITRIAILKYKDSGVENLYVQSKDRFEFVDDYTEMLLEKITDKNLGVNERAQVNEQGVDFIFKQVADLGLREDLLNTGKALIGSLMKSVRQTPKLEEMLRLLEKNKSGYMYKHTQMLALVSCGIVSNIEWGSKEFLDKICFVSFFHDIGLENPELAKFHTDEEVKNSGLSDKLQKSIMNHALKGAEILGQQKETPIGIDQIIRQHHGVTNGVGFTPSHGSIFSPLVMAFIISEDFVHQVLTVPDFNKSVYFSNLDERFSNKFHKVIDAMQDVFI